ncbi:MAG: potassium transporter TrkG [Eubacteriales bacterium]|nr:potassium transporter TrkG [Eubacteriales bacterium]MDD4327678.1 potassium transporter TrkG [Eubacteriales bacterium]MDD4716705.1 potassium transporter TrkG [Eubacteriales bacterium]
MEKTVMRSNLLMKLISSAQTRPARIITLSFLFVIVTGCILLMLPVATISGESAGMVRALFTATSATCVTGLVLVDTATFWSAFGQIVILCLIQIGGLGLVTITTFFFTLFRRKLGIISLTVAQESSAAFTIQDVRKLIVKIISFTFIFELTGALIFATRFIPVFGSKEGIYKAVFHSVSSFCNAGFDLMGNHSGQFSSLTAWNNDPVVVIVTALMIISGGLGFIVWADILNLNREKGLNFHTKLVLKLTSILIISGAVLFFIFEFSNMTSGSMGDLSFSQKIQTAFFQSVTTRTAGFNTIDQASLTDSSKIISSILMFIGASSGSTGGGIKLTTFAVLLFHIFSEIRGCEDTMIMRKRVSRATVTKSLIIISVSMLLVITDTLLISSFESASGLAGGNTALDYLFESISAFATVGLSSAGTSALHPASHILLILTMYIGRIGPAVFAIAITGRSLKDKGKVYPEARIVVG